MDTGVPSLALWAALSGLLSAVVCQTARMIVLGIWSARGGGLARLVMVTSLWVGIGGLTSAAVTFGIGHVLHLFPLRNIGLFALSFAASAVVALLVLRFAARRGGLVPYRPRRRAAFGIPHISLPRLNFSIGHHLLFLVMLGGLLTMPWVAYSLAADTYQYWRHGTQKQAQVLAFVSSSSTYRGGINWTYRLAIDEREIVAGFRYRLPVGESISVLTLADRPGEVKLGHRGSNLYQIFQLDMGGHFWAIGVLVAFALALFRGPGAFVFLLKNRAAFIRR